MKNVCCSFIIPVYNARDCLASCIESVQEQSDRGFELILIDDGSTDGSGEICDSYASRDDRIYVIHQKNGGHTAARNAGLAVASGKYIVFVDCDDWIDCSLLEKCRAALKDSQPDMILYGYRMVYGNGTIRERPQPFSPGLYDQFRIEKEIYPRILTHGHFALWGKMFRRELIQKHQLKVKREIKIGEDLACTACCMADASIVYVMPDICYNYRYHEDSMIHSYCNYTFEDWKNLSGHLDRELSSKIPNYQQQLGSCSIRMIYQAVLGELEREGKGLSTGRSIARLLKEEPYAGNIRSAAIPSQKRALRFKRFCLRYRLVYGIALADWVNRMIWRRRA